MRIVVESEQGIGLTAPRVAGKRWPACVSAGAATRNVPVPGAPGWPATAEAIALADNVCSPRTGIARSGRTWRRPGASMFPAHGNGPESEANAKGAARCSPARGDGPSVFHGSLRLVPFSPARGDGPDVRHAPPRQATSFPPRAGMVRARSSEGVNIAPFSPARGDGPLAETPWGAEDAFSPRAGDGALDRLVVNLGDASSPRPGMVPADHDTAVPREGGRKKLGIPRSRHAS